MRVFYESKPVEPLKPLKAKEIPVTTPAKEAEKFFSGNVICLSKTDKLCPFSSGKIYEVKEGFLKNDNGVTNQKPFKSLEEMAALTNIKWDKVEGYKGGTLYYTGMVYCLSSSDPHVFQKGMIYPVVMGRFVRPEFKTFIKETGGEAFCAALSKEVPARFLPVTAVQE